MDLNAARIVAPWAEWHGCAAGGIIRAGVAGPATHFRHDAAAGGYGLVEGGVLPGKYRLAERLGPARVAAVVASSPAIFASYAAARAANPGAFDGPANFAASRLQNGVGVLRRIPVLIDCGSDDPFAAQASLLRQQLRDPAGAISPGCHDTGFWRRGLPAQLAFLGTRLIPGLT
jgi:hypothetical protein